MTRTSTIPQREAAAARGVPADDGLPFPISYLADTADWPVVRANEAYQRLVGRTASALSSDPGERLRRILDEDRAAYLATLREVRDGSPGVVNYRFRCDDGTVLWLRERLHRVEGVKGQSSRIAAVVTEASPTRPAAVECQTMLRLLSDALESSPSGFGIFDDEQRLLFCNSAFAEPYGKSAAELAGIDAGTLNEMGLDLFAEIEGERVDGSEKWLRRMNKRMREGTGKAIEACMNDGRWILCSLHKTTSDGRVFIRTDITDSKAAEAALRASERYFRNIVEDHPLPVWLADPDCKTVLYESPAAADLFGAKAKGAEHRQIGAHWFDEQEHERFMRRLRQNGEIRNAEYRMRRSDGTAFWASVTSRVIVHDGCERVLSAFVDLTERKMREAEMRLARETLQDAIESLSEGFALYDEDDRLIVCNRRYRDFYKKTAEMIRPGIKWHDLIRAAAERGEFAGALGRVDEWLAERLPLWHRSGRVPEVMHADGRWYQISHQRTRQGGTAVIRTEVTHLKKMEQALRESEERFRSIVEAHPIPVVIVCQDDQSILYANPAAEKIWGAPAGSVVGSDFGSYFVDRADHARAFELFHRQGHLESYEVRHRRADGEDFPVAITSRQIVYCGADAIVTSVFDLSAQKAAESEIAKQREALYQSEKLNALGALLAGVSHELNNPLSVVVGQSIMLQETASEPELARRAQRIASAADRCARIVKTFLAMARQEPPEQSEVRLNDVVGVALDLTSYMLRSGDIRVTTNLAPDLPPVWADRDQLTQVLINLIVNAQQAMLETDGERRLKIVTRFDRRRNVVRLKVKDTGPGLQPSIRPRVFEPFFTTKPVGSGTGIGLAVSRGIVEAHGGTLATENDGGPGASFVISLDGMAQGPINGAVDGAEDSINEPISVLAIDDEPDILDLVREILTADGHSVVTARSGKEGLRQLGEQDFQIIISDLRMPGLDGPALYRLLKSERPDVLPRIIFITGDTLGPTVRTFLEETEQTCLDKPFAPEDLRRLVRDVLRGALAKKHAADQDREAQYVENRT